MKLDLRNSKGSVLGQIDVRDDVFDVPMNEALVHQVMVAQRANARQGTSKVKTRAQVAGGGIKPRPQKYTGRARQGSIRSPQWSGGGIVFGPAPRSYRQRTPKRMKNRSLRMMLSDKARESQLIIVDELTIESPKTKEMIGVLEALSVNAPILLVADGAEPEVFRTARNVPRVKMLPAALLNTVDLLNARSVVMTLDAMRKAEELWGGKFERKKAAVGLVVSDANGAEAESAEGDADSDEEDAEE